ncbi:MAG: hypothetical protein ACOYL6_17845 [Bacteriovoracaceae bacterium]
MMNMKKFFKKAILGFAVVSVLNFALCPMITPKAEAVVGLVAVPSLVLTAGIIAGTGTLISFSGIGGDCRTLCWTGGIIAYVGIILLDQTSQIPQFKDLREEQAQALGITSIELQHYRSELSEINALAEENVREMRDTNNFSTESSARYWKEARSLISSEAFSALTKISMDFQKQVAQAQAKK